MNALSKNQNTSLVIVDHEQTDFQMQIVNSNTGEPIQLPDTFKIDDSEGIKMLSHPRDWRCMVEKGKGYFQCNGEEIGKQIRMRVINYRIEEGILFSDVYKEPETVVQAVFIDEDDIVGTVVFRTASKDNFLQLVDNLTAKRVPIATQVVTATMERVTSKAGWVFHVVRFHSENNSQENFEDMKNFISLIPESLTCFRTLPRPE